MHLNEFKNMNDYILFYSMYTIKVVKVYINHKVKMCQTFGFCYLIRKGKKNRVNMTA